MYVVAFTPNVAPANALSAKHKTLIGAIGELLKTLDVLECDEWFVAAVLEAAKEAVDNLENCQDAKGAWSDMGCEDDAFSIDIFCADDARYVKFDDDLLLVPHGAIGLGVNKFNAQEWLYEEPDAGDWDDVLLPHVAYQPAEVSEAGLDAAVRFDPTATPVITSVTRIVDNGECALYAIFDDGARFAGKQKLFSFFVDELSFNDSELIGLTEAQAHELRHSKDVAYLRS